MIYEDKSLSIVVPVYNSEGIVLDLHKRLTSVLQSLAVDYEIILVNDGSPDNSWRKIESLAASDPHVKAISLRRNFGYDNALMAGLNFVSKNLVVIMDDDLQHDPEDIPALLAEVDKGFDVVYANFKIKRQSLFKNFGSWFVGKLAQLIIGKPTDLQITSYKILHREIARGIVKYAGPYPYLDGLIFQMTSAISRVTVTHHPRALDEGGHGLCASLKILFNFCTTFSILPLRIAVLLGFVMSLIAGVFSVGLLITKLWFGYYSLEGWTSIMLGITILGGIQLMGLGILGEYVGRTYMNINRQPQYVIRETLSLDPQVADRTTENQKTDKIETF